MACGGWEESTWAFSFSAAFFDLLVSFELGGCFDALALRVANGVAREVDERGFFCAFGMMIRFFLGLQEIEFLIVIRENPIFRSATRCLLSNLA